MIVSEHTYTVTVNVDGDPVTLTPLEGTVTMDDGWAPYIQAELTVAAEGAAYAALDPRDDARVQVTLTQTLHGAPTPATSITLDLGVRSRTRTPEGTVVLELASDEALAQDRANLTDAISGTYPLVVDLVGAYLSLIDVTLSGAPDTPMDEPEQFIDAGANIWDAIDTVVQQANLRLYVDEERRWWLTQSPVNRDELIRIGLGPVLQEATETVSRDDDSWADSVVVRYRWNNMAGQPQSGVDIAWDGLGPTKTKVVDHAFPYPGPGAAQNVLRRALARGRTIDSRAVSDYSVRPGMRVVLILPDAAHMGRVEAVTWSLEDDRMAITPRDLEQIDANAWVLDDDTSWLDTTDTWLAA